MPTHTPQERAMAMQQSGNPGVAAQPQQPQVQEMMQGDPLEMIQQDAMMLAQSLGPEQAGQMLIQLGQQMMGGGQVG